MIKRTKSRRPRICLIYTGGTIGMKRTADGTLRPPDNPQDFLNIAPELEEIVDLRREDFVPLMNKDSTNMNPGDWTKIATAVYMRRNADYKGFVIAHGTDTMHFSASAIAFALGENLNFPVVFTGAQAIPEVRHGDARINLLRACKVATMDLAEVAICFGDYVFRGCRAQKRDERKFDAFESPSYFPIGYITEEIILTPQAARVKPTGRPIQFRPHFAAGILQVSLIPGLEPNLLKPILESEDCRGVILQSFGAGNVPNEEPFSFEQIIRRAVELNKPVIITSQFPANATLSTAYEPGRAAVRAGAIPTGNMTAACAAAKFRWVLAQVEETIAENPKKVHDKLKMVNDQMQEDLIGELDKR